MAAFLNVCRFNPTLGGTTDWTYSTAVTGYQSPTAAGVVNGTIYKYRAESSDISQWELGEGAYNTGTGVLARTTVFYNSSGTGTAAGQSGAGTKINFSAAPQVAIVALAQDVANLASPAFTGTPTAPTAAAQTNSTKIATTAYVDAAVPEKLSAARTYYVRTDGSDSNTGLANTAGGAFLTVQKAVNTIATLNINGYAVTVQMADGTYTGAITLKNIDGFTAAGDLIIQGNNGTPANVVISVTSNNAISADGISSVWDIKDLKIATTTGGIGIAAKNGAKIRWGNLNFGATAEAHMQADRAAILTCLSNYAISGAATYHWQTVNGGIIYAQTKTITITGTPAFSASFVYCGLLGLHNVYGNTFSGSATGKRYDIFANGAVFTNGGGPTYFPGDVAGTTATGGQYT